MLANQYILYVLRTPKLINVYLITLIGCYRCCSKSYIEEVCLLIEVVVFTYAKATKI